MMAPGEIIALIALGVSVLFSVLSSTRSSAEDVRKQIEDAKKEAAEKEVFLQYPFHGTRRLWMMLICLTELHSLARQTENFSAAERQEERLS